MRHQQRSVLKYRTGVSFLIAALWTTAISAGCDTSGGRRSISTSPGLSIPTAPGPSGPGASGPTGSYTLTLTVSPTCAAEVDGGAGQSGSFPDFLQVRRYDAAFANGTAIVTSTDDAHNQVRIGGTNSYLLPGKPLMTMSDGELTILVPPADGLDFHGSPSCDVDGYVWYEAMSTGAAFMLCGTWQGSTKDPARIEGTIAGTFEYQSSGPIPTHLRCRATDHHFALTAKGQSSTR